MHLFTSHKNDSPLIVSPPCASHNKSHLYSTASLHSPFFNHGSCNGGKYMHRLIEVAINPIDEFIHISFQRKPSLTRFLLSLKWRRNLA